MSESNNIALDYKRWIGEVKLRIRQCQIKASIKVNTELLQLYWDLGADIVEKQQNSHWGDGFLKQMSRDLIQEFPEMKGFSLRNLERIRAWHMFYHEGLSNAAQVVPTSDCLNEKTAQVVPQLPGEVDKQRLPQYSDAIQSVFFSVPWGHHILI